MQPIERDPLPCIENGGLPGLRSAVSLHQLLKRLPVELAQALAHNELPLVECRAICQRKAGQKVVGVQFDRSGQVGEALGRQYVGRAGGQASGDVLAKRRAVQPEVISTGRWIGS